MTIPPLPQVCYDQAQCKRLGVDVARVVCWECMRPMRVPARLEGLPMAQRSEQWCSIPCVLNWISRKARVKGLDVAGMQGKTLKDLLELVEQGQ